MHRTKASTYPCVLRHGGTPDGAAPAGPGGWLDGGGSLTQTPTERHLGILSHFCLKIQAEEKKTQAASNSCAETNTRVTVKQRTLGQRLQTAIRRAPKSTAASLTVRLPVRLLLGAHTQTASGVQGKSVCATSVLRSAATPPGTDRKAKETGTCGMATSSIKARRWESPTTNTIWNNRHIALEQRHHDSLQPALSL